MKRDFNRLENESFDLLVIGGGIYGAWVAYDAATRGLRVALVEQDDWASATSSASSKLIHGGLRYLEHGHLSLVRRSLKERALLLRLAPHRVRRLRFLLPTYAGDRVGRTRMRIGLWLYDRLAGSQLAVGKRQVLDAAGVLEHHDLAADGLTGGFTFGDAQTDDARLTLELVEGAMRAGAAAVNRAQVRELLLESTVARGAMVLDRDSGRVVPVRAAATISCAGAWSHGLLRPVLRPSKPAPRLTKGVHLVMPALGSSDGILITSREDQRIVFLIPWYDRTLLGTTDTDHDGTPERVRIEPEDVTYLLAQANRVLRGSPWTEDDVISSYAGLRTLPATNDRSPSAVTREWKLEQPLKNLMAHVGGKLTSARADAAVAVDRVIELLGRTPEPTVTDQRPLPWSPGNDYQAWSREAFRLGLAMGLDEATSENCLRRHGTRVRQVFDLIQDSPELARRIVPDAPFCLAEVVHAVTGEMALSLDDVVRRRIPLQLVTRLDETTLEAISSLVGSLLDWSEQRRRDEVASVLHRRPLNFHETA